MRVLHLTAGNLYGGIETYLVTLARVRHLCPGMEPHFGLCFPGRLRDELMATGVSVHDLGGVRLSRPWTVWHARRRLRSALAGGGFSAVVTHGCWPHIIFSPVARRAGVRLAYAVHGVLSRGEWMSRWAARTAPDVVLANSRFTATPAAKLFTRSPVEVVYLPVAPPVLKDRELVRREVRAELGAPPDAVVILQASRLEAWKGQAVHIRALGQMKDVPGWVAWIAGGPQKVGESDFLEALRSEAERLGIADRVKFLGQRSDIPRLMAAADVYCQPNTGPEPFGLAFVEALAAGLPVVTSGFGGAAEIVDENCGVLTEPGAIEAVATALNELIRDGARRCTLGARGPGRSEELCGAGVATSRLASLLQPDRAK